MKVIDGYDKSKRPREVEVLPLSYAEVMTYDKSHIHFIDTHGKLRQAKVNGKLKRWKREPERFELPLKYGMYEYYTFTNADLGRLVKVIE